MNLDLNKCFATMLGVKSNLQSCTMSICPIFKLTEKVNWSVGRVVTHLFLEREF